MQDDITKHLAYEIKKEMADRYFGFRKLIEEDRQEDDDQGLTSFRRLEQKIGFDLIRIYILLKDENLIHEFFQLAGLDHKYFYDSYLAKPANSKKKALTGLKIRGLTKASRFKNMILDIYETLCIDIDEYRSNLIEVAEKRENIIEEINYFYRKHDLGTIIDFLRTLDGERANTSGALEGAIVQQSGQKLNEKMKVTPPPPVDELLPRLTPAAPLDQIKKRLKKIIEGAYRLHNQHELKEIIKS